MMVRAIVASRNYHHPINKGRRDWGRKMNSLPEGQHDIDGTGWWDEPFGQRHGWGGRDPS